MNTRTLGADLTVSAVGLGCMGFSHAYGAPTEKNDAIRSIRAAYDLGYTMFDTAETYGTAADPHENEKLVGEALKDIRNSVQIVTKFGIRFDETSTAVNKPLLPDSRPETIRPRWRAPSGGWAPTTSTCTSSTGWTPMWSLRRWPR